MKRIQILLLAAQAAMAQTETAAIQGAVVDAETHKPIPAALVIASRAGAPPFARNTKSGGNGEFQVQGLQPGDYALCAQAEGDEYLDSCQWSGSPVTVTLTSGQSATDVALALNPASVVTIQVQDSRKIMNQKTRDGRRPELSLGVWGPDGLYHPAHVPASPSLGGSPDSETVYRIAVPRDTALKFYLASRDLKLGDAAGAALPGNVSEQTFQNATGDPNPKSFAFTVLGLLP